MSDNRFRVDLPADPPKTEPPKVDLNPKRVEPAPPPKKEMTDHERRKAHYRVVIDELEVECALADRAAKLKPIKKVIFPDPKSKKFFDREEYKAVFGRYPDDEKLCFVFEDGKPASRDDAILYDAHQKGRI